MDRLRMLRARIDEIDGRMAELFAERMAAASEIAAWKKERGLPVRDSAREREILSRAGERIADPSLEKHYLALLECLMSESRAYQTERMAEDPALLRVRTRQSAYPVYLRRGCLSRAGELLELERRVFLVTDSGVPAAYADRLAAQCRAPRIFRVPAGEQSKSPAVLTELLSAMLAFGLTRGDCVTALGAVL